MTFFRPPMADLAHLDPITRGFIVPWVELNTGTAEDRAYVRKGLAAWRRITPVAIVSTSEMNAGNASLYREIGVSGVRIIPGIKTHQSLDAWDSEPGWATVAGKVAELLAATGGRTVILENETAMRGHWIDGTPFDAVAFEAGIGQLPEAEYLWYPGMVWHRPALAQKSRVMATIVKSVLGRRVRFTSTRWGRPQDVDRADQIEGQDWFDAFADADRQPVPIIYNYAGAGWWPDAAMRDLLLKTLRGRDVILYPGFDRWVEAARAIAKVLQAPLSPHEGGGVSPSYSRTPGSI